MTLARKLKINKKEMTTIGNQIIFDLDFNLYDEPITRKVSKSECGSWAIGVQDYMKGHSEFCPVHEDRTKPT